MNNTFAVLLGGALALLLAALRFSGAFAHEGGPQLHLDTPAAAPGAAVLLTGANLGTDLEVIVQLAGEGQIVPLGTVQCSGHGDFSEQVTLPADIAPGLYEIQVLDPSVEGAEIVLAAAALRIDPDARSGSPGDVVVFDEPPNGFADPFRLTSAAGLALILIGSFYFAARSRRGRNRDSHTNP